MTIIKELARMYRVFNKEFFDNALATPKFAIEPNRKFAFRYDANADVLQIGAGAANLGVGDFQTAFLHELVHTSNAQQGISDLTANQYHNKNFLDLALAVGLICIRHKNQGWSITTTVYPRNVVDSSSVRKPEEATATRRREIFEKNRPDQSTLRQFRSRIKSLKQDRTSKTFQLKYVCGCPPPHNSIRSGRRPDGANPLRIQCHDCGEDFVCEY